MGPSSDSMFPAVILMGVAGCGKSTFGRFLQKELGYKFIDGDDLHPASNIDKMSRGVPLNDDDRWPWLDAISKHVASMLEKGTPTVVACSALKSTYRHRLRNGVANEQLVFLHLEADKDEITRRLYHRENHFMPPDLIESQFAALESAKGEKDVRPVDVTQHMLDVEREILNAVKR